MKQFIAKLGTVFHYAEDLSGDVSIARKLSDRKFFVSDSRDPGMKLSAIRIPALDFMEFAAHVAGLPPWEPEKDAYDHETTELMIKHVETCPDCSLASRCSKYWKVILERVREKERRRVQ